MLRSCVVRLRCGTSLGGSPAFHTGLLAGVGGCALRPTCEEDSRLQEYTDAEKNLNSPWVQRVAAWAMLRCLCTA